MARVTRIKTSPDTLLPKGEGWRRITAPMAVKRKRQSAEQDLLKAKGSGNEGAIASSQAKLDKLRLAEKQLKENRKW